MSDHNYEYLLNANSLEGTVLDLTTYPWPGLFRVLVLSYRYDFNHLATLTLDVIKRESKVTQETQNE